MNPHKNEHTTRHHLIPRQRVKLKTVHEDHSKKSTERILNLWRDKHSAWHFLFHNLSIEEIIKVLQRVKRIKK